MFAISLQAPSLRFQGYQDFIASRQPRRVGRCRQPVDVIELTPKSLSKQETLRILKIIKLHLPDGTTAYVKPKQKQPRSVTLLSVPWIEHHLHERGAYILNTLLGFDIVPETDLLRYFDPYQERFVLASIQEGIQGSIENPDLSELEFSMSRRDFEQIQQRVSENPDQLFELYLYTVIAGDVDKRDKNVAYDEQTGRIYSIDNALSGADFSKTFFEDYPSVLAYFIAKNPAPIEIPEPYLHKIREFVAHQEANTEKLQPYYRPETIEAMFKRARFVLENPFIIPSGWELTKSIRRLTPPPKGSNPFQRP